MDTAKPHLWSEVECGQDVFVLSPRGPPRVVELEALITEVGPAVSAALRGFKRLRRFTELAHDGDAAQTHRVSVPGRKKASR